MSNAIYVKFHEQVVAVCDEELAGKTFKEGKYILNVSERFYKGKKVSEDELKNILKNAENANIVGERAVGTAIRTGLVGKEGVIYVKGIPHAQIVVL